MVGYRFSEYIPEEQEDGKKAKFDQLLDIFNQLITMTAGNVSEALSWITQLDKQYNLTDDSYGIADFIEDLKTKGYLKEEKNENGESREVLTAKGEQSIRKQSLDEIFGKLKKTNAGGNHRTPYQGTGDETNTDRQQGHRPSRLPHQVEVGAHEASCQYSHDRHNPGPLRGF